MPFHPRICQRVVTHKSANPQPQLWQRTFEKHLYRSDHGANDYGPNTDFRREEGIPELLEPDVSCLLAAKSTNKRHCTPYVLGQALVCCLTSGSRGKET
jgi:hypothetical protein